MPLKPKVKNQDKKEFVHGIPTKDITDWDRRQLANLWGAVCEATKAAGSPPTSRLQILRIPNAFEAFFGPKKALEHIAEITALILALTVSQNPGQFKEKDSRFGHLNKDEVTLQFQEKGERIGFYRIAQWFEQAHKKRGLIASADTTGTTFKSQDARLHLFAALEKLWLPMSACLAYTDLPAYERQIVTARMLRVKTVFGDRMVSPSQRSQWRSADALSFAENQVVPLERAIAQHQHRSQAPPRRWRLQRRLGRDDRVRRL